MKTGRSNSKNWFLGDMEPIILSRRNATPDRRQISIRWLLGSILAGSTSLVLMGGALFAALDGRQQLAAPASLYFSEGNNSTGSDADITSIKGSRVGLASSVKPSTSNIMMVSTIKRENDRDVVKVRPFMLINAPLAIAPKRKLEYPKFNPLAVFSDAGDVELVSKSNDLIYGANVESEVSIKVTPFLYKSSQLVLVPRQRTVEIEELVRRANPGTEINNSIFPTPSDIDPTRFSTSSELPATIPGAVITAENVSVKNRIYPGDYVGVRYEDRIIQVRTDTSLEVVLEAEGMDATEAGLLKKVVSAELGSQGLLRGDKIRMAYRVSPTNTTPATFNMSISRLSIYRGASHIVSVARSDNNQFRYSREPARPPQLALGVKRRATVTRARLPSAYDGINRAALSEGMGADLAKSLIRIFAFDVDFRSVITPIDELTAFISLEDGETSPGENSEILFASIKLNNIERKYYRFRDAESGRIDYYGPDGKSAKKFLLRKPVPNARFSSAYGWRIHPISRVRKMHWGVDWAAPRNTPILAAGDGIITRAGWAGGRGKQTVIKHANGYVSSYSHQAGFAKNMVPGTRVRQGQIIGYVGSTGNSTGNHVHYEVSVNGNKVNSMRIRLPKGKILKGDELLAFEAERDRIDALLKKREDDTFRLALN